MAPDDRPGAPPPERPPGVEQRPVPPRLAVPLLASPTVSWLRRFAKLWGFALFCIFIVYIFRAVALPFIFAILVAYILAPLVNRFGRFRLGKRPFPRAAAVLILYVNILALLALFVGYFIPKLSGDFARMFREAPQLFSRVNREWLPRVGALVDRYLGAGDPVPQEDAPPIPEADRHQISVTPLDDGTFRIDLAKLELEVRAEKDGYLISAHREGATELAEGGKWERSIKAWIAERLKSTEVHTTRALEYGQRFVAAIVSGIGNLFLVLMVAAFILVDMERIQHFLRSLVPERYQSDYDVIVAGIDRGLAGVIRGQLVICLVNGILTYIGLWLFHVKYPLLLAGVASVMSLIPIFGSILSSIPIVAIALISSGSFDLKQGIVVLAWIIGIHALEANFLNPKIMGDAAKIHPVLVVFSLIAGEHTYGIVGALFAVPVASIIQTLFLYFRHNFGRPPRGHEPA